MIEIHIRHGEASAEASWGLTEQGKMQAQAAASYLQLHFPGTISVGIYSGSRRAIETAGLLGLPDIEWNTDERLREADWNGGPVPRDFDRWKDMYTRVSSACNDWDANQNKITVSHGGTMQMVRAHREQLTDVKFHLLFEEPLKYFTNCQMIIYTDQNPTNQIVEPGGLWVKSVCPWDLNRFGHDWIRVR